MRNGSRGVCTRGTNLYCRLKSCASIRHLQDEMLFYLFDVLYKCIYFMSFMEGHIVEKPIG